MRFAAVYNYLIIRFGAACKLWADARESRCEGFVFMCQLGVDVTICKFFFAPCQLFPTIALATRVLVDFKREYREMGFHKRGLRHETQDCFFAYV